jgi:cytochrome c-type biogenesis protein CcmH/NrfG
VFLFGVFVINYFNVIPIFKACSIEFACRWGWHFLFTFASMKIKYRIQIVALVGLCVFASCGNDAKKVETKKADSSNAKISAELKDLNDQLATSPNNAEVYNLRAKYYFKDKNFPAGFSDINAALKIDSSKAAYFYDTCRFIFCYQSNRKSKNSFGKKRNS